MPMTEQQFIEMEGNIHKTYFSFFKMKKDYLPKMYNIIKGTTAQITDYTLGAPSRMKKWQGSVSYDTIVKGYEKQYKAEKYDSGVQIDRDLWEDKEYQRIKNKVLSLTHGVFKTMQYESVALWNDAFAGATYLGPDGKALCASDHKTVPSESATQSNTGTLDLNYTNLEATRIKMENFLDDKGDKMLLMPNCVIAGQYWADTLEKMFGSEKSAFTADNDKNIYKDHKYIINPLITGKKWFYVDDMAMRDGSGINMYLRKDPRNNIERDGQTGIDFNTEVMSWKVIGRWDIGFTNWYSVYGNNPS